MKVWMLVLLICGAPLAFYLFARTINVRFETRIEIETPAGIQSGSRVMNVSYTRPIFTGILPMEARGGRWRHNGEALAVEVVPGRYLFALIGSRYTENEPVRWLGSAFRPPAFHKSARTHRLAGWLRSIKRSDGYFDLPVSHYPPMVSFKDMNDSATVFQVEPDALEGVFGPGVSLKSFAIRVVNQKIEIGGLQRLLPWLTHDKEPGLCAPTYSSYEPLCANLTFSDFLRTRS